MKRVRGFAKQGHLYMYQSCQVEVDNIIFTVTWIYNWIRALSAKFVKRHMFTRFSSRATNKEILFRSFFFSWSFSSLQLQAPSSAVCLSISHHLNFLGDKEMCSLRLRLRTCCNLWLSESWQKANRQEQNVAPRGKFPSIADSRPMYTLWTNK